MNQTSTPVKTAVVLLGKTGDLILSLPALKQMHDRTGEKPVVIVSEEYAGVLDGASYVDHLPVCISWREAWKARQQFHHSAAFEDVYFPKWWDDVVMVRNMPKVPDEIPHSVVRIHGVDVRVPAHSMPNYMGSIWSALGGYYPEMMAAPVLFDRRNEAAEAILCREHLVGKKPFILYNLSGTSSPFPYCPELFSIIREFKDRFTFIDLSAIKARRVYDLLGLMERSVGLITIDTATLHLASACKIPYIGLTNTGWSGSVCKGNVQLSMTYPEVPDNLEQIRRQLAKWDKTAVPKIEINHQDPPSILEQTAWHTKILDPQDVNADYFNCGLVEVNGSDYLVTRRSQVPHGQRFAINDIVVFKLEHGKLTPHKKLELFQQVAGEHFEDPRIFRHDGQLWLSCCNFIWSRTNRGTFTHQVLFRLDENFKCLTRYDVGYGCNGPRVDANTRSEKNWLWFFHDGLPHLIYAGQPHLVARFNERFEVSNPGEDQFLTKPNYGWKWGEIRGGTPPVRIGNEYWTFFHSSEPCAEHASRRYHMGAYAFEAKAPFMPTRITREPLLSGSRHDRRKMGCPVVVFCCGSLFRNHNWLVSFGVNDIDCAIIEIPHSDLIPLMKKL